jgi:uncharacterized repeat protein (TIGR01451 family)
VDPEAQVAELREDNNLGSCFGTCEAIQPAALLPITEKWKLPGIEVETAPLAVQLTDDNGDGRIDGRDVADVVFHMEDGAGAGVTARSGLDGSELWTVRSVLGNAVAGRLAHAAAADLDGDGVVEILVGLPGKLGALDSAGRALWVSDPVEGVTTGSWGGSASMGDLDGDGVPEIAVGRTVLSNSGRRIAVGTANKGEPYNYYAALGYPYPNGLIPQHSIIADVDLDGRAEVVAGDAVYRLFTGQLQVVWDYTVPDNLMRDGFVAVANLDSDPQAEIVYVASGFVMVFNHDGTVRSGYRRLINLSPFTPTTYWGSAPTIADLDGDGVPEILVAGDTELVAMRASLATYWRRPIDDLVSLTGVTVFDLDGDGYPEVLFADQSKLWVLDGRTGAPRFTQANLSKTACEYPVVADLDHDGRVEILLSSNRSFGGDASTQGLHVLTGSGWTGSRPIWNEYAYHVTNVQLDGTVPSPESPSWQAQNTYRANLQEPRQPQKLPNATLGLPRVAATTPAGIPVTLRVGNGGRAALPRGLKVRLYGGSNPQTSPVVGEGATSRALAPGEWEDVVVVWRQAGPAGAPGSAVVDPTSALAECDEADNTVAFTVAESVFPDLVVPAAGVTAPASPVAGQKLPIQVQVRNDGPAVAAASVLRLYDGPPSLGRTAGQAALPALNPGETRTLTVDWDAPGATGRRLIFAAADADETVVELVESNNQGFTSVTLAEPTKADLSVETLDIAPASVTAGTPVTLTAVVMNRGLVLAGGTAVAFKVNNAEVARVTIPDTLERGAQRTVSTTLATLSLNGHLLIEAKADPANAVAEQNESNNSKTGYLDVLGSGLVVSVRTDKVAYGSNQTVAITVTAQNNNTSPRTPGLRVTVQDGSGQILATLQDQPVTLSPGSSTLSFSWSTGATPAGPYVAVAELVNSGAAVALGTAPFSISQDRMASAQLFADRSEYEPDQTVALTGRVRNTGVNASLTSLVAKLEVRSPGGTVVWTKSQTIQLLSPGAEAAIEGNWPVGNAAPGVYTASLDVREQGGITPQLAYAATQVTVLDSSQTGTGLTGDLSVSPSPAGAGAVLLARFTTRNGGNAAMPGLRLRLRLVRLSDGTDALVQELAWPLARGEQKSGALGVPTAGLAEEEYQVKLDAVLPTKTSTLASQDLSLVRGVSVRDAAVQEGDGGTASAVFEVVLSSPSLVPVLVDYSTSDGTATAGSDYNAASGTLTFEAGETAKTIAVTVHGDLAPEADEAFLVSLSNPAAVELADAQAIGEIEDEEGCASPNLLANPGAEEGTLEADLPGWTLSAGGWSRRLADPMPLDGAAAFAVLTGDTAELVQEVNLAPYADPIDHQGSTFAVEGFLRSSPGANPARGRVIVEYRDAAGTNVLGSYDSGELASPGAWQAVSDARMVPAGTRRARVRLLATRPGGSGEVFFDRLGLRSLGIPVLTAEVAQTAEGNTGTTPLQFQVSLSCSRPGGVSVSYVTVSGTAAAGTDYDSASGTLTFPPGGLVQTVDVAVRGDVTDEKDETLQMVFTGSTDMVVLTPQVTGTIVDDDGPVTVSIGDAAVTEGNTGTVDATFTVTLSDESGQEVRVGYATANGTAATGTDFVSASGTAVFPPGTTSQTVSVQVKGDLLDEPAEGFFVRLSSPLHATIGDGEGEGRIEDDDEVLIAVNDVRLAETDSGTTPATFTVTLSVPSVFPVTVQYATANGTALTPADYTAASGTLTFAPGTTSQTVAVSVVGELVKEPEETFFLRLSNPTNALLGRPEGVGTIVDNDGVLISVADLTVREGATNSTAAFKITLSKSFNQPIAVSYQTVDGTTTAGADYQAASGTVTFAAGTTTQTVNVTVLPDVLEEPVESFFFQISNPTNGALILKGTSTAMVIDGDLWTVNGSASDLTIPGCVLLTPDQTWLASSAWRNDRIDLGQSFDKTFKVFLGNHDGADGIVFAVQNAGYNALGNYGEALGHYPISPSVGVEIDTYQNSGEPSYDHIAVGSGAGMPLASPVQARADSPDVEDGLEHDMRVIWNAVTKELDTHFDGSERLIHRQDLIQQHFNGVSAVIYGFTSGTGGASNLQYFCETELCYGTAASPKISVGDARVTEPDTGSVQAVFPVTLSCPADHPVTVGFTTTDGTAVAGADYLALAGTLTFLPGERSKSVSVAVLGENLGEADEVFYLDLSGPAGGAVRYGRGTGTIVSDEMGIFAEDVTMVEPSAAGGNVAVRVRLVAPASSAVSVKYATADGTARAGQDYTAVSGTLTFQVGETFKDVFITLAGDTVAEPAEQFFFRLSNPTNGEIIDGEAVVQLLDDDDCPSPNLLRNGSIEETTPTDTLPGWTKVLGTQAFRRTGYPGAFDGAGYIMPVDCPEAEVRQDVNVSSFAAMIDAGIQRFAFAGYVSTYPDAPYDGSRFIVEYRNAANTQVLSSFDSGELSAPAFWRRVADLRAAPAGTRWIRVRLHSYCHYDQYNDGYYDGMSIVALGVSTVKVGDITVVEGSSGTQTAAFPVQLSCASALPVQVSYLTSDGTATAPSDYQTTLGTLVFQPGEVSKTVAVPVLGDTVNEGNETFFLNLASSVNAGIADAQGQATIPDDEVSLSVADVSVVEGSSGTTPALVKVTLSGPSTQVVTVDTTTQGDTATGNVDYTEISGTITFNPGETSKTIQVDVIGDTSPESDEKSRFILSNPVNAYVAVGQASVKIVNDDLGLSIADANVIEGNSGTTNAVFNVKINTASSVAVSVKYATRDASATAGVDYVAASGTLTFAAGETAKTIAVAVKGDTLQETGEIFYVDLSSPVNASIVDGEGLGSIGDDDGCPGPNLLANPGGEEPLVGGKIPGWTEVSGFTWAYSNFQGTYAGANFMFPGASAAAELRQDVDLTPYAAFIDAGIQRFSFEGYVRSADAPPDPARVVLEYLDANKILLGSFDSGEITNTGPWRQVADLRTAPEGTRWARLRLIGRRISAGNIDAYFDGFLLRSLDTPVASAADITIQEGDTSPVTGTFTVQLTCAGSHPISLDYATADGTATAPSDYDAVSGTLQLNGQTSQPVAVSIAGDFRNEIRETFLLRLSHPVSVVVLDPEAVATIRDADPGAPPVPGTDVSYTLDADFDLGIPTSVNHDAPGHDQLQISAHGGTFPYLWVAESAKGMIVKIDTKTGTILGEYSTNPDQGTSVPDPSRTTVALDGSVWVGNRGDGSVLHVGLPELGQCIDRNGNGVIDTSSGFGDVLAWPGTANLSGGATQAQDECILHFVKVSASIVRHVSVDRDNNVWVSGYGGSNPHVFNLINGDTGQILRTEGPFACGGYGGFVDGNGIVWSSNSTGAPLRWDPSVKPPTAQSLRCIPGVSPYGLAIDSQGNVWGTDLNSRQVWKISPDGNTISGPYLRSSSNSQGLAVDGNDHVWVSSCTCAADTVVGHFLPSGTFLGNVTGVPVGSTGVAVDSDGKIWTANLQGSSAARIDPTKGPLGSDGVTRLGQVDLVVPLPGASPYNYSDMTGFIALRSTASSGRWFVIQDAGAAGAAWGMLRWNQEPQGSIPSGGSIVAEVRAADTVPALGSKSYLAIGNGVPFVQQGRYLQVRFTLKRNAAGQSPVLSDLRVQTAQNGALSVSDVTVTEGNSGTTAAAFEISLAQPLNRNVSVSYATADGTALAGQDYTATTGSITIPYGETRRTVTVPVLGDTVDEADETFRLVLSAPVNATLVKPQGTATLLDDDAPARPDLHAEKTAALAEDRDGDGVPSPGDVLAYEVVIRNLAGAPATEVIFRDVLPAHTKIVAGSVTSSHGTVITQDPVEVAIGTLVAGESATVRFRVAIDPAVPLDTTEVSNQGQVLSSELPALPTDDPALGGASDPTVTPITLTPKLVAEKTAELVLDADGDGVPSPGDALRYGIRLLSVGNTPVVGIVLRDDVPANTQLVAGSVQTSQGTLTGESPIALEVGELAVGESATVHFEVRIDNPIAAGVTQVANQGTVESGNLAGVLLTDDPAVGGAADPTVTVVSAAPVLAAEKTAALFADEDGNGYVSPGDVLLYRVLVSNRGNTAATRVVLADPVPVHTTVVAGSVQASQGTVVKEAPVEVDLGEVAAGSTVDVTFQVAIDPSFPVEEAAVSNQGRLTSGETAAVLTDDPGTPEVADPTRTEVFIPVELSIADVTVSEGVGSAVFPVTLDRASNHPVSVTFSLSDGTARAGEDYVDDAGSLSIPAGSTSASLLVEIVSDAIDEADESFAVHLTSPTIGRLADGEAVGTIRDDDEAPLLAVDDVSVEEGESGTVDAVFTVTLSTLTSREVRVHFATTDDSAHAPEDYVAASGDLVLPAGVTSATVRVQVVGDRLDEADERFMLRLSQPVGALLGDGEGQGTILDDEQAELSVGDVEVREGDAGTVNAVFPIHLSSVAVHTVTIRFSTSGITATPDTDFVAASGQVSFAAGETDKSVTVQVKGDLLLEPDETFQVTLAGAVGAALADAVAVGTILDDEVCLGENLVLNPGAEERPAGGEIPGWKEIEGTQWLPKSAPPLPFEGLSSFFSNLTQYGELRQDVDVSAFGARIDAGLQRFAFSARLRSFDELPPDVGRVVVEYRDASNQTALALFDSGEVASVSEWREVADTRTAPAGTRWIRVRLLTTRLTTGTNDSFFDAVSLRPLGTAAVSVDDVTLYEGSSGLRDAVFTVRLSCPNAEAVNVSYATANGTAQAPGDYLTRSGSASFAPGAIAAQVPVPVVGDKVDEPNESFFLNLALAPGSAAVLADPQGKGTIWNDDFCQRSPGYWKTHPSVWAVEELQIGGVWYYKSQLQSFLSYSGPDASSILTHHLVATKLNLERGSDPTWGATPSVLPTVDQADLFLAAHPPGSNPSGADRELALRLKDVLDVYNNAGCRP